MMRPQTVLKRLSEARSSLEKAQARVTKLQAEVAYMESLERGMKDRMFTNEERDTEIARLRLADGLTYSAIGERFGLSLQRVSQIVNKRVRIFNYRRSRGHDVPEWY